MTAVLNIAVTTILFQCCIANSQCRVPGAIFCDAPSILEIGFAQGFSMSILFPKPPQTFEMELHFGFTMTVCNRFVQRPMMVQLTFVSSAGADRCSNVVVVHMQIISPRMCNHHITKHFQRFVIASMSLCEHLRGVCFCLSTGVPMWQQTCSESAKFWFVYHAHHDGLFENIIRNMGVKVDLLHCCSHSKTLCISFLAMWLTKPNLFPSFRACESKGFMENLSMILFSHLVRLVRISFVCANRISFVFTAGEKLKTNVPDADGSGVGTCPCDRCCPASDLDANGILILKLEDILGVIQMQYLGKLQCTDISFLRAFLSENANNLVWYNMQTTNPFVTCFRVHYVCKDHLVVHFASKINWHLTPFCTGPFTCLVYLKFWFMKYSGPATAEIVVCSKHLSFSHSSPKIKGIGYGFPKFLFYGIPFWHGIQKTSHRWPFVMKCSIMIFGIWIARGRVRQPYLVQLAFVWNVILILGYPTEISQLTGRIGKKETGSCRLFQTCNVQVFTQTVTSNMFRHCLEKIHLATYHCSFRVSPVSCSVVCWTCGLIMTKNQKMYRTPNSELTRVSLVNAILALYPRIDDLKYPAYLRPKHISFAFDSSLGFPGEGPDKWTCITANVESLATHPHYLNWQDDAQILQEIRVAQSNYDDVKFKLKTSNRYLHCSRLLELKQQKNSVYRIPHGGTGIIAPQALLQPFCASDDITGKWEEIACTTRVTGAWMQVQSKLKILVFSFYGHTCHTDKEEEIHELNNRILSVLFEISTQFGDVPIIIGGDFQKEPETFDAFQQAKMHKGWVDPISRVDEHGNITRPITFSRSGNFINPADSTSSLDALLLNESAAAALESIEVIVGDARQHAPIRATFCWPKIYQTGYILVRPAPMSFSNLVLDNGKPDHNMLQSVAHTLWNQKFSEKCANPDDNISWKSINQYGIEILQKCGAEFGKGPKTRGCKPQSP